MALHAVPMNPTCWVCDAKMVNADNHFCPACSELRVLVMWFVASARWRNELTVIQKFARGSVTARHVENTLFYLVTGHYAVWFGAEGDGQTPMNYRATNPKAMLGTSEAKAIIKAFKRLTSSRRARAAR